MVTGMTNQDVLRRASEVGKLAGKLAGNAGYSRFGRRLLCELSQALAQTIDSPSPDGLLPSVVRLLQRRVAFTEAQLQMARYITARTILDLSRARSRGSLKTLLEGLEPDMRGEAIGLGMILAYASEIEAFRWTRSCLEEGARRLAATPDASFEHAFDFDSSLDRELLERFCKQARLMTSRELYSRLPQTSRTRLERSLRVLLRRQAA
jgi:hypothetical protein